MSRLRPIAAFFVASALLPACMTTAPTPQMTVKPHAEVRHAAGTGVDHYELGKYHQANGKLGFAMDAYVQALKLNNRHVEARNGLATLYSQQGRFAEAETLLRDVVAQGQGVAYLHNNLGYIYYLQGKHVAAIRELRTAISLDPNHEWARNNLKLAEAGLDRRMAANAEASPRRVETTVPAFEAWGEIKGREAKSESILNAASVSTLESAMPTTPESARTTDHVARILSQPASRPPVAQILLNSYQPKPRATVQIAKTQRSIEARTADTAFTATGKFRLEISNGNGVEGFAKRVSQILARQGIPVHSLTNQLPYGQRTTEIQYRDGFEQEAEQLKISFRGYAIVARASTLRPKVDLRVVLGQDLATRIAEIDAERPALAAISNSGTGSHLHRVPHFQGRATREGAAGG